MPSIVPPVKRAIPTGVKIGRFLLFLMPKKRDPDSRPAGEPQRILMERLDEMGVTMKTASLEWLKRNHAYLRQYIFEGVPQYLDEADRVVLAQFTGLTEDEIGRKVRTFDRSDSGKVVTTPARPRTDPVKPVTEGGPILTPNAAVLPVYAATQGGPGHMIVTFEAVDYKSAPEEVMRAKGAHGVLVVGDSMVPAYWPGDIVWVMPYKPLQRDKDYVLYHGRPSGEAECMIKRVIGFSDRELRLRQWNPLQDFTESRKDWPVCHQIHSKNNA